MPELFNFEIIAKRLENHKNLTRIKKLMVYACTNQWESDLNVLNEYKIADLIKQLRRSNLTLENLRSTLYTFAESLNHYIEYSLVADTVVQSLEPLYSNLDDSTQVIAASPPSKSSAQPQWIVSEIAKELESNSNSLRIKKLILFVWKDDWETNNEILNQLNLVNLVQGLRETYPTIKKLSAAFKQHVELLNRQEEYIIVAKTILKVLQKLYNEDDSEITHLKLAQPPAPPPTNSDAAPGTGHRQRNGQAIASSVSSVHGQAQFHSQNQNLLEEKYPYNHFDLRLNIMKYTTPLRAKFLIFSALYHPVKKNQHDWLLMKAKSLDELLLELFSSCPTVEALKTKLSVTVQALEDSDENSQAAGAIVQSMKQYYGR